MRHPVFSWGHRLRVWLMVLMSGAMVCVASPVAHADELTGAQRRAALEFLQAMASGDAQAVAYALHPSEADRLRITLQQRLRAEAERGESTLRSRLFGALMPLADVERMTSVDLFRALGPKLDLRPGVSRRDRAHREWKAALPSEIDARIEDLLAGRGSRRPGGAAAGVAATAVVAGGEAPAGDTARSTPDIFAMLAAAEQALVDGRCDIYHREHLSPSLRRGLGPRALDTLIASCSRSVANRELLIAALRLVQRTPPVYEVGGERAVYDLSGQGLPYDRYVLERIERRWYIAE